MTDDTRRRITDICTGVFTVVLVALALYLVRCSSRPQPTYYAPDPSTVRIDTIRDTLQAAPTKPRKTKDKSPRRPPHSRQHLDEPVGAD